MEAKMQERYDAADTEMRLRQDAGTPCPDCGGSGAIIHATGGGLEYEDVAERCSTCEGFGLVRVEQAACPGIEIEPGVLSGCDQSAGDCPSCGK